MPTRSQSACPTDRKSANNGPTDLSGSPRADMNFAREIRSPHADCLDPAIAHVTEMAKTDYNRRLGRFTSDIPSTNSAGCVHMAGTGWAALKRGGK